jgi:type II secretory pathway component GspD/PulD (secretin)
MKGRLVLAALIAVALTVPGRAQEQKPAAASQPSASATHTLKIQLVLSRYQADKKISSLPYTLTAQTSERGPSRANMRLGTQVPITTMSKQSNEANAPLVPTVQYRDVGTSIDCLVTAVDDVRFRLDLTVEDSSVETAAGSGATTANPAFKSFRTTESVVLRDGQSTQ